MHFLNLNFVVDFRTSSGKRFHSVISRANGLLRLFFISPLVFLEFNLNSGPGLCPVPTQGVNVSRQSDHTSLSGSGAIGQKTELFFFNNHLFHTYIKHYYLGKLVSNFSLRP